MKVFRLNKAAALIVVLTSSSAAVGALTAGTYETTGKGSSKKSTGKTKSCTKRISK